MNDSQRSNKFWFGNAVLLVALLFLLKLDAISELIGFNAMVVWIGLVAAGVWLLMQDQKTPPPDAD